MKRLWMLVMLALLLAGCSGSGDKKVTKEYAPEVMYRMALNHLQGERFKQASVIFTDLDQKHPFSPWAVRAQLNLIFVEYKKEEFDEAVGHAKRFIRLHPRHPEVSYAFYMIGLAHYKQIKDAYRDQARTKEAATAFREVINRFPESDYAWEAKKMLDFCRNRMAQQEVVVGRYYFDRGEYIAAMKRFNEIIDNPTFRDSLQTEEALFTMILSAMKLGLNSEARNYAAVLGHNFGEGRFYAVAKDIINGKGGISRSDLEGLRPEIIEDSIVQQFLEGMRPGLPGMFGSGGGSDDL
ncbi:outer membrane protein assembly factor BamD [Magnetococcus sp. PR-3]|uniref:outer membrane protein assembly factor BamD n=1 Tax=Magnetococcus sp. PR-3 TaxID=3120355 RepID=UPI002FCE0D65